EEYRHGGAELATGAGPIWKKADMIVKVKQPLADEVKQIRADQIVMTYFHFAADLELMRGIIAKKCVAIAYETIQTDNGLLPLLTPMSEIAGRMAVHEGAKFLEEPMKGRGLLLAGVPGVAPAKVVVLGGGVVGANAAKMAAGLGANVSILDINLDRLRYLDDVMPPNVTTLMSNTENIRKEVKEADLLIGAVLIPGAKTPRLVSRELVSKMKKGAVIVDVAVDQGGCVETTKPTTHENPSYIVDGVVHYCVTNMPGAVARTSSKALTNATFPFILEVAKHGWEKAAERSPAIRRGLNIVRGKVVHPNLPKSLK
ncbi:MAG: alanine dehydrogenase, partial [Verrucomicrobiae bacterium]|nr:alanine dehydrogenase [Verrucomicrobiae bacterium]